MALVNKTTLKGYFKDQEIITPDMFVDVFDSTLKLHSDHDQTVAGETTFSKGIKISNGNYNAPLKLKVATMDDSELDSGDDEQVIKDFFTEGMIPLSLTMKVTTAITANAYVTTIGTQDQSDAFCSGIGDGVLEAAGTQITCAYVPVAGESMIFGSRDLEFILNANAALGNVIVAMVYIDGASIQ